MDKKFEPGKIRHTNFCTKSSTRSPIQRSKISGEFASLVVFSTKRLIAFGSKFLLSPMKGNDFLISEIVEKTKQKSNAWKFKPVKQHSGILWSVRWIFNARVSLVCN